MFLFLQITVAAPEITREQILDLEGKRLPEPEPEPEDPLRPKITDDMVQAILEGTYVCACV